MALGEPGVGAGVVGVAQLLAHVFARGGHRHAGSLHGGRCGGVLRTGALQIGGQAGSTGLDIGKGVELAHIGRGACLLRGLHLGGGRRALRGGKSLRGNPGPALVGGRGWHGLEFTLTKHGGAGLIAHPALGHRLHLVPHDFARGLVSHTHAHGGGCQGVHAHQHLAARADTGDIAQVVFAAALALFERVAHRHVAADLARLCQAGRQAAHELHAGRYAQMLGGDGAPGRIGLHAVAAVLFGAVALVHPQLGHGVQPCNGDGFRVQKAQARLKTALGNVLRHLHLAGSAAVARLVPFLLDPHGAAKVAERRALEATALVGVQHEWHAMQRHGVALGVVALGHHPHEEVQRVLGGLAPGVEARCNGVAGVLGAHKTHQQLVHHAHQVAGLVLVVHAVFFEQQQLALGGFVEHAHRGVDLPHGVDVLGAHAHVGCGGGQAAPVQAALAQQPAHVVCGQAGGDLAAIMEHVDGVFQTDHPLARAPVVQHGTRYGFKLSVGDG